MNEKQKVRLFPYFLILFEIAIYLSNDMYLPSMPTIAQDLSLTQHQIQNTLTFWFLGASSLQFIMGPLSDCYGRRAVIIFGGVCFVVSSAVCAMSNSLGILLIARFVQGTAICSALVAGYAAIHELFNTYQAIKILAFMSAVTILAPAFGPLFGALLAQFTSWRYIFWFLFVFGLATIILLFLYMPESNTRKHKLNIRTILQDYRQILTNTEFMLPTVSYCLLVCIYFVWMFEAPFIMIEVYGHSTLYYGLAQAFIFGCFFLGAELTKLILSKHNVHFLLKFSIVISLLGTVLFAVFAKLFDDMLLSIICMMIIATGTSMLFGPLNRIAVESSTQPMGRRTAVFSTAMSAFGALIGWLLTLVTVDDLSTIAGCIIICMGLATLTILQTRIH